MGKSNQTSRRRTRNQRNDDCLEQFSLFTTAEEKSTAFEVDADSPMPDGHEAVSFPSMENEQLSLMPKQENLLANWLVDFFNSLDTKYKGTFYAEKPKLKVWEHTGSKKKNLSIYLSSPAAQYSGDSAFTYFNRADKTDEITINEAIYNNRFLSELSNDKDFSISLTPNKIHIYYHNFESKQIDFSLAEKFENTAPELEQSAIENVSNNTVELTLEMYNTGNPDIFKVKENSYLVSVEVTATNELWERFADKGLAPTADSKHRIVFETDGKEWNRFFIPDIFGNKWNNIKALDILTPDEVKTMWEVIQKVIPAEKFEHTAPEPTLEVPEQQEYDGLSPSDILELRERLAASGIVNGQLVDPDALDNNPFIRQVLADVERLAAAEAAEAAPLPEMPAIQKLNYKIPDDFSVPSGAKSKYQCNVSAIRLLKQIESEHRLATVEEQTILSAYVGFGGIPQAFDENNEKWKKEYAELTSLLSEEEYSKARASTLNAHYTSPTVIKAMYQALENMGFEGGKILEPAMGIGNFFGLLPDHMSKNSKLYGVELDSLTGRIAKQLYQSADIKVCGFEETKHIPQFDVAIGNIPFGDFNLSDEKYTMRIHDYFFLGSLDSVKENGVVAFITSKGTLDKANPSVRKMLAQRADLLGAIRLPNTAFKENAGTEVTTDILFLQKRSAPPEQEPDWVYLDYYNDSSDIKVNCYFKDNPHMVLGTMVYSSLYGGNKDTACVLEDGADFELELDKAISHIKGNIQTTKQAVLPAIGHNLPLDSTVKRFTYTVFEDNIYYNNGVELEYVKASGVKADKLKAYINLSYAVRDIINIQLSDGFTEQIFHAKQQYLNNLYDDFVEKYGYINERSNQLLFADDMEIALLSSIEDKTETGYIKGAIFSKPTIRKKEAITSADTPMDALLISLSEKNKVDVAYMSSLCGKPIDEMINALAGHVFISPDGYDEQNPTYLTAEEYLSDDVKSKLVIAKHMAEEYPLFAVNVTALEEVQPAWIPASDIGVRLSSHWIDSEYVNQFIYQLLNTPTDAQKENGIAAKYDTNAREWYVRNKTTHQNVLSTETYGTSRISAYEIIQSILNQREVTIRDAKTEDGQTKYIYNHDETVLARQRKDKINDVFKDWIFKDTSRRHILEQTYNDIFNRIVPRTYDGSYIKLDDINPDIHLEPHQLNGVARIRSGGNTLLAHVVGAGKTYTMIAGGMEQLRLGIKSKLLYAVPNHMTEQFGADFLKLYPNATILIATEKDFEKQNRRRFIAKIATADIDAVIIGHSQFERIPISVKRKKQEVAHEIESLEHAISSAENEGQPRYSIKRLERAKMALFERMKKLLTSTVKDDVIDFEQLGIDSIFIDEAHYFKNGAIHSKMSNISGVASSSSFKAADMLAKTRYINEIDGSVTFATGTPISNSISEMYVLQRYLQEKTLRNMGIYHFDEWASDFGEITTGNELKPEGGGYRSKTRFSGFFNLPELMTAYKQVADVQTDDMLNLKKPKLIGGKAQVNVCEPNEDLLYFMDDCVIRAEAIRGGLVDSSEDNMLKMTTEARKAGTDMRLIDSTLAPDINGKIFRCAENIYHHYEQSHEFKATQIVFCDISTPNKTKFNVYDELTRILIEKGIPQEEIARIHDADSKQEKEQLFADMRSGSIRVLIGSTQKCGAGTNIQNKLLALHHLDCPYRPSDIEQREGRILRPYNDNEEVSIYRYVTERSFDSYLWQIVEKKQRFISQVQTSKAIGRTCEEIDDVVLSFAEVKAIASGNPLVRERMELEIEIDRLTILKQQYKKQQYFLQDRLSKEYPIQREQYNGAIDSISKDLILLSAYTADFSIELGGQQFIERATAAEYLAALLKDKYPPIGKPTSIGKYKGFEVSIATLFGGSREFLIKGNHTYHASVGESPLGNITRLENKVSEIKNILKTTKGSLATLEDNIMQSEKELNIPFSQETALAEKKQRMIELTAIVDVKVGAVSLITDSANRQDAVSY